MNGCVAISKSLPPLCRPTCKPPTRDSKPSCGGRWRNTPAHATPPPAHSPGRWRVSLRKKEHPHPQAEAEHQRLLHLHPIAPDQRARYKHHLGGRFSKHRLIARHVPGGALLCGGDLPQNGGFLQGTLSSVGLWASLRWYSLRCYGFCLETLRQRLLGLCPCQQLLPKVQTSNPACHPSRQLLPRL